MTIKELRNHPTVLRLIEIQEGMAAKDIPFAQAMRFKLHGANWGKIKAGTYTGRPANALADLTAALDAHENPGQGEVEDGIVILPHVREALDAVDIATTADEQDEHRLVVVCGPRGSGKTRTLSLIRSRHSAHFLSARPSWSGAYLNFLNRFADGLKIPHSRSAGDAEEAILSHLAAVPCVICIDEFNHFSPAAINFIKAILNETRCVIVTGTIPHHLARMSADRATAQESVQLLRRAVAIIHIPSVAARTVELLARAFWPELKLGAGAAAEVAAAANRLHRVDSACQILADAEDAADIPAAVARHERACKVTLRPGEN